MGTQHSQPTRGRSGKRTERFWGLLTIVLGVAMLYSSGYFWAMIPVILGGLVIFPLTRSIVTFGWLGHRKLHNFIAGMLWLALLFTAVLIAQPWK